MALGLNGVIFGTITKYLYALCLYFKRLLIIGSKNYFTDYLNAHSDSDLGNIFEIGKSLLIYNLKILEERTIIYIKKSKLCL